MKYINKQFVRWDDLDAFGHVNNARYLTFAQEARFLWSTEEFSSAMRESSLIEMVVARDENDHISTWANDDGIGDHSAGDARPAGTRATTAERALQSRAA